MKKITTKQIRNGKEQKKSIGITHHHALIRLAAFTLYTTQIVVHSIISKKIVKITPQNKKG